MKKYLFKAYFLLSVCEFAGLTAHDHVTVVTEGGYWHHPSERVYVGDPWYHRDHVYVVNGHAYPHYYYGYPYYYYDPSYYYLGAPVPSVNVNVQIP